MEMSPSPTPHTPLALPPWSPPEGTTAPLLLCPSPAGVTGSSPGLLEELLGAASQVPPPWLCHGMVMQDVPACQATGRAGPREQLGFLKDIGPDFGALAPPWYLLQLARASSGWMPPGSCCPGMQSALHNTCVLQHTSCCRVIKGPGGSQPWGDMRQEHLRTGERGQPWGERQRCPWVLQVVSAPRVTLIP